MDVSIYEMSTSDIEKEISSRQFELLGLQFEPIDKSYVRYVNDRIKALKFELEMRKSKIQED